ncbi:MAG: nucleoside transporter [Planctomycetes bacterium]|nr:nucleoside transporter [Planctomycetota bacterium]
MDIYNLVSFLGLFVLIGFAWLLSANRRRVNPRTVVAGMLLQLVFAGLLFWTPGSRSLFLWLNDGVVAVLDAAKDGQKFVFGALAAEGEQSIGFILACQALPLAIVFAALMALLYHWGIMQRIIRGFAWVFTRAMRTSGAESLVAASNIFVGVESATTVRPYLGRMTQSELCTVLAAGMATIASTVMAFYVSLLKGPFPTIAGHLISASVLSAPAAIVMSKVLVPETGEPVTLGRTVSVEHERESSAIAAIISGATAGLKLVFGIVALLIALLGLLAIVNLLLGALGHRAALAGNWLGGLFDAQWQLDFNWSLEGLLGYVMYPFALVMGVPPEDAAKVGQLLGTRLVATEIPAYINLAETMNAGGLHHPRTAVVTAYALCGFAHVASLAIFVGGIAALAPERKNDLARVGVRALLAATLACLMTGAVAGTFFHDGLTVLNAAAAP